MKQAIVGALVIVAVGLAGFLFLEHEWTKDRGPAVGYVLEKSAKTGRVRLEVVITRQMVMADVIPMAENGTALWDRWMREHFELRDESGQTAAFQRAGTSQLIDERKAFNPEFYIWTRMDSNRTYTLDYIPVTTAAKRYRYTFAAPLESQAFDRVYFPKVKGD